MGTGFAVVFLACSKLSSGTSGNLAKSGKAMKKDFRQFRVYMPLEVEGFLEEDWEAVLQKLGFVPEAQNDMIFSIICEELGLAGGSNTDPACLYLLIWRLCVSIATHAADFAGALICGGIMGHMAIQVILNIAVVTNTIPNTGITLPFVSYGGTSVVFLLGEMGLALGSEQSQKQEFIHIL